MPLLTTTATALLAAVTFVAPASATTVSGDVGTATWTAANSPYRVTGAVHVPAGSTLTIEPGVDVLFDA